MSVSNASYATLPGPYTVGCGPATLPCNPNSTVAPDSLVSAFGTDLATGQAVAGSPDYPTRLGGTSVTLVDSSDASYAVPLVSVASGQVNYMVPPGVQTGPASLTLTSGDGTVSRGIVLVAPVAASRPSRTDTARFHIQGMSKLDESPGVTSTDAVTPRCPPEGTA